MLPLANSAAHSTSVSQLLADASSITNSDHGSLCSSKRNPSQANTGEIELVPERPNPFSEFRKGVRATLIYSDVKELSVKSASRATRRIQFQGSKKSLHGLSEFRLTRLAPLNISIAWMLPEPSTTPFLEMEEMGARQALCETERKFGRENPNTVSGMIEFATILYNQGRISPAEFLARRGVGAIQNESKLGGHLKIHSLLLLSSIHTFLKGEADAESMIKYLRRITTDLHPQHPLIAYTLQTCANLYANLGKLDEAEELQEEAEKLFRHTSGPKSYLAIASTFEFARLLLCQGKTYRCKQLLEKALQLTEGTQNTRLVPVVLGVGRSLAIVMSSCGDYSNAETLLRAILAESEILLGPNYAFMPGIICTLGIVLQKQGKFVEAKTCIREGLERSITGYGRECPQTIFLMQSLAHSLYQQQHYAEALPLLQQALGILDKISGAEHEDTARCAEHLENCFHLLGRDEEALPLCQRILERYIHLFGAEHGETFCRMKSLAICLHYLRGNEDALASYHEAVERYIQVHGAGSESAFRDAECLAFSYSDSGPPESEVQDCGVQDCEAQDCEVHDCEYSIVKYTTVKSMKKWNI
jgi:tetratricopeptide (TPR) repeat protein